jgi:hypothetical protein
MCCTNQQTLYKNVAIRYTLQTTKAMSVLKVIRVFLEARNSGYIGHPSGQQLHPLSTPSGISDNSNTSSILSMLLLLLGLRA